jgi:hypothetical protein
MFEDVALAVGRRREVDLDLEFPQAEPSRCGLLGIQHLVEHAGNPSLIPGSDARSESGTTSHLPSMNTTELDDVIGCHLTNPVDEISNGRWTHGAPRQVGRPFRRPGHDSVASGHVVKGSRAPRSLSAIRLVVSTRIYPSLFARALWHQAE